MKISANRIRWVQMNWLVEDTPRTSDPWTNYIYVVDSSFLGVLLLLVEIFERKQEGSIEIQIETNECELRRVRFERIRSLSQSRPLHILWQLNIHRLPLHTLIYLNTKNNDAVRQTPLTVEKNLIV